MPKHTPDERVVYLALKNIFKGDHAQLRNKGRILKLINKHKTDTDVEGLVREHNIDIVCNVAADLLAQDIFLSTIKAKIRFPEVFEVSPAQSAERSISETEAARTEVDAIRDAAEGRQEGLGMVDNHKGDTSPRFIGKQREVPLRKHVIGLIWYIH